jgi:hypothetical protein
LTLKIKLNNMKQETQKMEIVYIDFLNKDKRFRQDRKYFEGENAFNDAVNWAKKNLQRYDEDMIKYV